jgi:hypothetical protein
MRASPQGLFRLNHKEVAKTKRSRMEVDGLPNVMPSGLPNDGGFIDFSNPMSYDSKKAFGAWEWAALQLDQHPEERIHDRF